MRRHRPGSISHYTPSSTTHSPFPPIPIPRLTLNGSGSSTDGSPSDGFQDESAGDADDGFFSEDDDDLGRGSRSQSRSRPMSHMRFYDDDEDDDDEVLSCGGGGGDEDVWERGRGRGCLEYEEEEDARERDLLVSRLRNLRSQLCLLQSSPFGRGRADDEDSVSLDSLTHVLQSSVDNLKIKLQKKQTLISHMENLETQHELESGNPWAILKTLQSHPNQNPLMLMRLMQLYEDNRNREIARKRRARFREMRRRNLEMGAARRREREIARKQQSWKPIDFSDVGLKSVEELLVEEKDEVQRRAQLQEEEAQEVAFWDRLEAQAELMEESCASRGAGGPYQQGQFQQFQPYPYPNPYTASSSCAPFANPCSLPPIQGRFPSHPMMQAYPPYPPPPQSAVVGPSPQSNQMMDTMRQTQRLLEEVLRDRGRGGGGSTSYRSRSRSRSPRRRTRNRRLPKVEASRHRDRGKRMDRREREREEEFEDEEDEREEESESERHRRDSGKRKHRRKSKKKKREDEERDDDASDDAEVEEEGEGEEAKPEVDVKITKLKVPRVKRPNLGKLLKHVVVQEIAQKKRLQTIVGKFDVRTVANADDLLFEKEEAEYDPSGETELTDFEEGRTHAMDKYRLTLKEKGVAGWKRIVNAFMFISHLKHLVANRKKQILSHSRQIGDLIQASSSFIEKLYLKTVRIPLYALLSSSNLVYDIASRGTRLQRMFRRKVTEEKKVARAVLVSTSVKAFLDRVLGLWKKGRNVKYALSDRNRGALVRFLGTVIRENSILPEANLLPQERRLLERNSIGALVNLTPSKAQMMIANLLIVKPLILSILQSGKRSRTSVSHNIAIVRTVIYMIVSLAQKGRDCVGPSRNEEKEDEGEDGEDSRDGEDFEEEEGEEEIERDDAEPAVRLSARKKSRKMLAEEENLPPAVRRRRVRVRAILSEFEKLADESVLESCVDEECRFVLMEYCREQIELQARRVRGLLQFVYSLIVQFNLEQKKRAVEEDLNDETDIVTFESRDDKRKTDWKKSCDALTERFMKNEILSRVREWYHAPKAEVPSSRSGDDDGFDDPDESEEDEDEEFELPVVSDAESVSDDFELDEES